MSRLAEISRATGMGIATVSEILRNKPGYREETRQRVLEAAERLHYRPNLLARGLRAGSTKTIGIVAGDLHTPITMYRIADVEYGLRQAGYHAYVMHGSNLAAAGAAPQIESLLTRRVDGLVICRPLIQEADLVQRLVTDKNPTLFVDFVPDGARWGVAFDKRPAMRQVAAHLAELGHRRATFMLTHSDWMYPSLKLDPWREALAGAGMALDTGEAYRLPPVREVERETYQLMRRRLAEGPPPTAILMNNDACAIAAMAALADAGLRVPDDVSLVGFDGLLEAEYVRPALTTVYLPGETFSATAVSMLLAALRCRDKNDRTTLAYQACLRQSTGPVRAGA